MEPKLNTIARFSLSIFRWFCKTSYREEIEGDLFERFGIYYEKYGEAKANNLLIKEVFLLFRPGLIGNFYQLTHSSIMTTQQPNKRLIIILATASGLLLIPLIANNLTSEVNWDLPDFLIAAVLLMGTGLTIEFILRKIKIKKNRFILVLGLLLTLILVWMELAVGIFGTPLAGS